MLEDINYHTISASLDIAREKGRYAYFEGSDRDTGACFDKRRYHSERWASSKGAGQSGRHPPVTCWPYRSHQFHQIIAGTTAGIDPIMSRFYYDEKERLDPRCAPDLNTEDPVYYVAAHLIDQLWSIRAGAACASATSIRRRA